MAGIVRALAFGHPAKGGAHALVACPTLGPIPDDDESDHDMGMLKSAMMFKAGKAVFDKFNQSRGGTARGSTRPAQTRRTGTRGSGGTIGRLARSVMGGRR